MRILFLVLSHINSNSSAMIRNRAIIHGLLENGYKVDVLTLDSAISKYLNKENNLKHENLEFFTVNSPSIYKNLVTEKQTLVQNIKKNIVLPILRYLFYKFSIYDNTILIAKNIKNQIILNRKYDVVISSSDPKTSHIAMKSLITNGLKYSKWIQYWGDPMAFDITKKSIYPTWYLKKLEEKFFNSADKIIYVSPLTLENQKKEFQKYSSKMSWLPIPYIKIKEYIVNEFTIKDVKIGYFGDYNSKVRNILPLYDCCKNNNIMLVVTGESDLNLYNTDKIRLLPRQTTDVVEKLEEDIDILVCILNTSGTQIPGKIYHYAAANKPILIILDGEYKQEIFKYLNEYNRFVFCDNKVESIKESIKKICLEKVKYKPLDILNAKNIALSFLNKL